MVLLTRLGTAIALSSSALAQTCYFPNGNVVPSDTACNPNALVSACCFDGQACLSNGLCVSDPKNAVAARLHRGTCTDKGWKSGNCPRHCTDIDNNGVPVYSCNSTTTDSYCCYDNCSCNSQFETFSFQQSPADVYTVTIIGDKDFQPQTVPPSSRSTSTSASSSASTSHASSASTSTSTSASTSAPASSLTGTSTPPTSAPTSTPFPQPAQEKKSNSTAIGAGVGVGVGTAVIIGAVACLLWHRKKRNEPNSYVVGGDAMPLKPVEAPTNEYIPPATRYAYYADGRGIDVESHRNPATTELPAMSYDPIELPAVASLASQKQ